MGKSEFPGQPEASANFLAKDISFYKKWKLFGQVAGESNPDGYAFSPHDWTILSAQNPELSTVKTYVSDYYYFVPGGEEVVIMADKANLTLEKKE